MSPKATDGWTVVIRTSAASKPTPTYSICKGTATGVASAEVVAVTVIGPPTNAVSPAGVMNCIVREKVSSAEFSSTGRASARESASAGIWMTVSSAIDESSVRSTNTRTRSRSTIPAALLSKLGASAK